MLVGDQNAIPEQALMQAPADGRFSVLSPKDKIRGMQQVTLQLLAHGLVERHHKLMLIGLLLHEPHGVVGFKGSGGDSNQPDKRLLRGHRRSKSSVVVRGSIGAAPLVARVAVLSNAIVIRRHRGILHVRGENAYSCIEPGNLADASLLLDERDRLPVERERLELCPCDQSSGAGSDRVEVGKRSRSEVCVEIRGRHDRSMPRLSRPKQLGKGYARSRNKIGRRPLGDQ